MNLEARANALRGRLAARSASRARPACASRVLLLALLVAAFGLRGAAALEFECVAQIGGATRSVALDGTTACLAQGHSFVTIDVSDPTRPVERGRLLLPEAGEGRGMPMRVAAADGRAFVVFQSTDAGWWESGDIYGLHVLDVEDPAEPAILATLEWTELVEDLVLEGDLLYVVGEDLRIFDVSELDAPSLIGSLPNIRARRAALSGTSLVFARGTRYGGESWGIVDASDPTAPVVVHDGDFEATDVVVRDSLAYLGGEWRGSRIYDIADPAQPVLIGESGEGGHELGLLGSMLFGCDDGLHASILDVSDPASPTLVRVHAFDDISTDESSPEDVKTSGSLAYIAWSDHGLLIISLEQPTDPRIVGSVRPPTAVESLDISGGLACVGLDNSYFEQRGAFRCIDVSNPRKPTLYNAQDILNPLGSYEVNHASHIAALSEGIAYVADYYGFGSGAIRIVDVRDPAAPVLLGEYEGCSYISARRLEARGGLLFVRDERQGLTIHDITNPVAPSCLGYGPAFWANSMKFEGNLAYFACWGGLRIFDVSNPAATEQIGILPPLEGDGLGLAVFGTTAYVATFSFPGPARLLVVDISDPRAPSLLAETSVGNIRGSGGGLLAIERGTGDLLFDTSDPTDLRLLGSFPPFHLQTYEDDAIVFSEGYAYLRTTGKGVVVYHVGDRSPGSIRDKLLGRSRDPLAVDPSADGVMDIGDLIDALE